MAALKGLAYTPPQRKIARNNSAMRSFYARNVEAVSVSPPQEGWHSNQVQLALWQRAVLCNRRENDGDLILK